MRFIGSSGRNSVGTFWTMSVYLIPDSVQKIAFHTFTYFRTKDMRSLTIYNFVKINRKNLQIHL